MVARAAMLGIAVAAGCGGTYGGKPVEHPRTDGNKLGIEAAALPYQILDRAGHQVDEAAFWTTLAASSAVCVGEEHPNPHHHWVQLEVVRHLAKGTFGLGMEMFQRPFQGVLDDFAAKKIDDATLRSRAGWEDRWGYPYDLYGPILHVAVDAHASLIALNAAKELTKKVSHHGLDALTPDEKAQVPELDLHVAAHRAWFDALMEEMGGGAHMHHKKAEAKPDAKPEAKPEETPGPEAMPAMPSMDQIYTVQVIWDETMADTSAKWLGAHAGAHLVILAGNGHCHDSAIVGRMKRRGVADALSLRVVVDDGEGAVAEVLAKPMNDFVVVLKRPATK